MSLFTGLIKPTYDETFTSWVYRCSIASPELHAQLKQNCAFGFSGNSNVLIVDPDFDRSSVIFVFVCQTLQLNPYEAWLYFKPSVEEVTPWPNRLHFCRRCLESDLEQGRLPSWRKSWCYALSTICSEHKVELSIGSVRPSLDKAWACFSSLLDQKPSAEGWEDSTFSRVRACIIDRVNRCRLKLLQQPSCCMKSNYVDAIYILSLKTLTYMHPAGAAIYLAGYTRRRYYFNDENFYDVLLKGPGLSQPKERFLALLFAGWISDLIPDRAMRIVTQHLHLVGVEFPRSPYIFGCGCITLFTIQEYFSVMRLFGVVNDNIPINFKLFLSGLERSASNHFLLAPQENKIQKN